MFTYFCQIFQGIPLFLEEGRYSEIETFKIPSEPKSIRLVKDDMGSPELFLASSTNYEGKQTFEVNCVNKHNFYVKSIWCIFEPCIFSVKLITYIYTSKDHY